MAEPFRRDAEYQPPSPHYLRNSLTYGLVREPSAHATLASAPKPADYPPEVAAVVRQRGRLTRGLIKYAYVFKKQIKRVPLLHRLAISIKNRLVTSQLPGGSSALPILDLSGIMGLEISDFVNHLYLRAFGRAPDPAGLEEYKQLLCWGASKEAIAYVICTSREFAGRAEVAHRQQYRKAYWSFRARSAVRKLPLVGWLWSAAAMPSRVRRLEARLLTQHADALPRDQHRFEELLLHLNALQAQLALARAETAAAVDALARQADAQAAELTSFRELQLARSSRHVEALSAQVDELRSGQRMANDNIVSAHRKLDETAALIARTSSENRPFLYSLPGGVTAVRTKDYTIGVPSEDWRLALFLSMYGFVEQGTERYYRSILKAGMNVLDIGANLGIYTLSALAAGCHVYSYEPTPRIYRILVDNIGINGFEPSGRAHPFNLAVSDAEGETRFAVFENSAGQNNTLFAESADKFIDVKTVCLDQHLGHLPRIDVAKIDVEGAEPLVLQGMQSIIARNPHIKIIMEFAPTHLMRGGNQPREFIDAIHGMGFRIYAIDPERGSLGGISDEDLSAVYTANILLTRDAA
jgi:FkbM family methyltransferase